MSKTYVFVGSGVGVPGLPHVITESEAKQRGVLDILKDAIANGNYEEKKIKKSKEASNG